MLINSLAPSQIGWQVCGLSQGSFSHYGLLWEVLDILPPRTPSLMFSQLKFSS